MLDVICYAFIALFGVGAGFFVGAANQGGWLAAIPLGVVLGAVLCIPFRHDLLPGGVILFIAAIVGALIMSQVPERNSIKQGFRNQTMLNIHVGPYQMGRMDDNTDKQ